MSFAFAGYLAPLLLGVSLTRGGGVRRLGEVVLVGPLALLLVMAGLSQFGIPLRVASVAIASGLLAGIAFVVQTLRAPGPINGEDRAGELRLGLGIVAVAAIAAALSLDSPFHLSDPIRIYAPQAVSFAANRALEPDVLAQSHSGQHLDYPPLFSANLAWLYLCVDGFDGWIGKPLGALFLVGLLCELIGIARAAGLGRLAPLLAVAFGLLPATLREATAGFADIVVTAYLAALVRVILEGATTSPSAADASRVALFLLGAAASKNEGLVVGASFMVVAIVLGARGPRGLRLRLRWIVATVVALALVLPWHVGVRACGLENDLVGRFDETSLATTFERLPAVIASMARLAVTLDPLTSGWLPQYGLAIPIGLLAAALAAFMRGAGPLRFVVLLAPLQLAIYALVLAHTPNDLEWHLRTALPRLLLHPLPALAAATAMLVRDLRSRCPADDGRSANGGSAAAGAPGRP